MRILLVEDDTVLHAVIRDSLKDAGNRVDSAWTLAEASHIWSVQTFDAVVLDLNLPDGSGLVALRAARARGDRSPVLRAHRAQPHRRAHRRPRRRRRRLSRQALRARRARRTAARAHAPRSSARTTSPRSAACASSAPSAASSSAPTARGRARPAGARACRAGRADDAAGPRRQQEGALRQALRIRRAPRRQRLEAFVSRLRKKLVGSGSTIRTLRGLGYLIEPDRSSDG